MNFVNLCQIALSVAGGGGASGGGRRAHPKQLRHGTARSPNLHFKRRHRHPTRPTFPAPRHSKARRFKMTKVEAEQVEQVEVRTSPAPLAPRPPAPLPLRKAWPTASAAAPAAQPGPPHSVRKSSSDGNFPSGLRSLVSANRCP